ncbi:NUDIX domain-containing protein [Nonomuraea sp. 10N515B]|uniref:NUDIX domain-containing protein n=1 Tax=Nonomuraea sp. 10N515B TaxID=3457422 RepID=UPI003FCDE249
MDAPAKYDMTATNLVFRRSEDTGHWVTGVAYHVRLGGFLPAGGHWEDGETLAETALRETVEELGCRTLIIPGLSSMPAPAGYPHPVCPAPWWVIDCRASADSHTPGPHRHLDHTFVSIFEREVQAPETAVDWLTRQQVKDRADLSHDSRLQLLTVFPLLDDLTRDLHVSTEWSGAQHLVGQADINAHRRQQYFSLDGWSDAVSHPGKGH